MFCPSEGKYDKFIALAKTSIILLIRSAAIYLDNFVFLFINGFFTRPIASLLFWRHDGELDCSQHALRAKVTFPCGFAGLSCVRKWRGNHIHPFILVCLAFYLTESVALPRRGVVY